MKIMLLICLLIYSPFAFAQTTYRDDAGLRGDAGATSGYFEAYGGTNYPSGPATWWHLLDVRHSNPSNNYAMQFAGSFFDQNFWVRKTNNDPAQAWSRVIVETAGNVGIGTASPQSTLSIRNTTIGTDFVSIIRNTDSPNLDFISNYNGSDELLSGSFGFGVRPVDDSWDIWEKHTSTAWSKLFTVKKSGNVGIGIPDPDAKLTVNGTVHAKEVKVDVNGFPDYVFEDSYHLPSLNEIEIFIKNHKHLPEVPSAAEVAKNGLELGEMNKILLRKIEELTLHLIEKDKEIQLTNQKVAKIEGDVIKKLLKNQEELTWHFIEQDKKINELLGLLSVKQRKTHRNIQ